MLSILSHRNATVQVQFEQPIREALTEIITKPPMIVPTKDERNMTVPLFNFYQLIDDPECYEIDGEVNPRKIKANIDKHECIVLDYDDGEITLEDARELYKDYWYCIFTSYQHTPEKPRFRVFLPLEKPIKSVWISANKEKIIEKFPHIDRTTFDPARFFFFPCCADASAYQCWINEGKPYRLPRIAATKDTMEKIRDILNGNDAEVDELPPTTNWVSKYLRRYQVNEIYNWIRPRLDRLDFYDRGKGEVHEDLCKKTKCLYCKGLNYDEVLDVFLDYAPDEKTEKEMVQMVRQWYQKMGVM